MSDHFGTLCIKGLNDYGFGFDSLKLINYLSHRKQRTKINHSYCSWEEVLFEMLQGSKLGLILFNSFLSDLFLIIKDTYFASYADDNTIYKANNNINEVITYYNSQPKRLFIWFSNNQMKGNSDKYHFIISSKDCSEIKIGNSLTKSSNCNKILGVKIDTKLTFDDHIKDMCRKANSKLCVPGRVSLYMGLGKKKLIMSSFFAAV